MLIIIFGLPGSGKSYFARHLAKKIEAVYLSSDILRKEIFQKPTYSHVEKARIYNTLVQLAEDNLRQSKKVILDATFHQETWRQKILGLATKYHTPLYWIQIIAEEHLSRERLQQKRENSDADFSVYQKMKSEFEPFDWQHLILKSTNNNIKEMLQQAMPYLKEK